MVTVTSKLLDVFWCKCIFSCVQIKVGCLPPCICHWISMRVNHQFCCCLHLNPVEVHCLKDARLSHCQALQAPWLLHSLVSFFVNLQGTFVTELGMFECLASDWNFCLHLHFGMHTHTHTFLSDAQRFLTWGFFEMLCLRPTVNQKQQHFSAGLLWICLCTPASADLQVCSGWLDADVWIEVLCSCVAFHGCEFSLLWYKNKKNPHTFHAAAIERGRTARLVVGPWCIWSLVQE